MDTFDDLRTALNDDITSDSSAVFYNTSVKDRALNRSYLKAAGLYRWPELEDAKKTSTLANQEYYDYPQNWQADSIWKIRVDGVDYGNPLTFDDYLFEIEQNFPSNTINYKDKNIWTSQWRRFFIRTQGNIPANNGSNNIEVWGQKVVTPLSSGSDVTIFSYSLPECNEAIVQEAAAILKAKGEDQNASQFRSSSALTILTTAWNKIRQNQSKYQKTRPLFNWVNLFPDRRGGRNTSNGSSIGDF